MILEMVTSCKSLLRVIASLITESAMALGDFP